MELQSQFRTYGINAKLGSKLQTTNFLFELLLISDDFLSLQQLTQLCIESSKCVSAFAVDKYLQDHLHQAGVIWHLLLYLFKYDFTLDESGVDVESSTNQQVG